jgi:hypothetical protein
MSLAGFQQALTAMTLDAALAGRVRQQGAAALGVWPLTPRELRRLAAMAQQPGMELNCTLARGNRFATVHDAFAMSCALLGPALRGVLDALWSSQQPSGVQLVGDVERFAAVAMSHVRMLPKPRLRACLRDLLAYEQAAYKLAAAVRHHAQPELARPTAVWVDFEVDPQPLFAALRAFEPAPTVLVRAAHRVRLALVDGALETTIFEVQRSTADSAKTLQSRPQAPAH